MARTLTHLSCLIAAIAGLTGAKAQDLTIHAGPQTHAVAIVNATIHPVSGPSIARGYIHFDKGVIVAVGEGDFTLAGPGAVIDATGKHVYPGMIGSVTQIGLSEISSVRAMRDHTEVGDISPEVRAAVAVNPDSWLIPVARSAGILTVGSFPTGGRIPGRASIMRLNGWTWEEMAVKQSAGLIVNWPNVRPVRAWWMTETDEEQQQGINRGLQAIDHAFDTALAYHRARRADSSHPVDLRWEAMGEFLRPNAIDPGLCISLKPAPTFIFAQDVEQITSAVIWAAERGLNPVIVGGRDAPIVAELLKKHDVPVIVLGTHRFPKRADSPHDEAFTLPLRLEDAGVRWCLASGEEPGHERNLPHNAATAVEHGLPEDVAIAAITLRAAEILGVSDVLGSLEPGKAATLIVTDGSPLEIRTNVQRAFIDGRAIDLSNKQTVLDQKFREKYRQQEESTSP